MIHTCPFCGSKMEIYKSPVNCRRITPSIYNAWKPIPNHITKPKKIIEDFKCICGYKKQFVRTALDELDEILGLI